MKPLLEPATEVGASEPGRVPQAGACPSGDDPRLDGRPRLCAPGHLVCLVSAQEVKCPKTRLDGQLDRSNHAEPTGGNFDHLRLETRLIVINRSSSEEAIVRRHG